MHITARCVHLVSNYVASLKWTAGKAPALPGRAAAAAKPTVQTSWTGASSIGQNRPREQSECNATGWLGSESITMGRTSGEELQWHVKRPLLLLLYLLASDADQSAANRRVGSMVDSFFPHTVLERSSSMRMHAIHSAPCQLILRLRDQGLALTIRHHT